MSLNIKYLVMCLIIASLTSAVSIAQQEPNNAFKLEAMPKATKGFPLILRVTVPGPQKVDQLSILHYDLPVTVYLKSKTDGNDYIIKSARSRIEAETEQGVRFDPSRWIYPPIDIPKGQKYSMIFDLWSLAPVIGTNISLNDVPPGKYSISVELVSRYDLTAFDPNKVSESDMKIFREIYGDIKISDLPPGYLKSNSIDLELVEPTERETQFLQKIIKRFSHAFRIEYVNWTALLPYVNLISDNDVSSLTEISKEQISFNKLISDANVIDEQSRNKSINEITNAKLPTFFEPEQKLLLLELKGNPVAERENLLKQHPELKWRVDKLSSNDTLSSGGYLQNRQKFPSQAISSPQRIEQNSSPNETGSKLDPSLTRRRSRQ